MTIRTEKIRAITSPVMLVLATCVAPSVMAGPLETYTIDNDHTHIVWQVDRFGFAKTIGTFADIDGTIAIDRDKLENSHVNARIALAGLRSDMEQREEIVRGPAWLDADAHPIITFQSTSVVLVDDGDCPTQCAQIEGLMTLKGVTAPLSLRVKLNKDGTDPVTKAPAIGFSATGSFSRADYGVTIASQFIGPEVTFQIETLAVQSRQGPKTD